MYKFNKFFVKSIFSIRAYQTASQKWSNLLKNPQQKSHAQISKISENFDKILDEQIRKQVYKQIKHEKLEPYLEFSRFKFEETQNLDQIKLKKTMGSISIEIYYKPVEPIISKQEIDEIFSSLYAKVLENTNKINLTEAKFNLSKVLPFGKSHENLTSTSKNSNNKDVINNSTKIEKINVIKPQIVPQSNIMKKLHVILNLFLVLRDKQNSGIIAECTSENSKLNIHTVYTTNNIDNLLMNLSMGKYKNNAEIPKLQDIDRITRQNIILWLRGFGLNEKLLSLLECNAVEKEQNLYLQWLKDVKKFLV